MSKDNRFSFDRRNFLRLLGLTGGAMLGAKVIPTKQYFQELLGATKLSSINKSSVRNYEDTGVDEFVGPFPSWINVKTDYGAVGDGITDDTDALQNALNALRPEFTNKKVMYLPAGTYRITRTIGIVRETHNESIGFGIIGEDPNTTIIHWDGSNGGVMFDLEAWHYRITRLTFNGNSTAGTAIRNGRAFSTANEITDAIFKNVEFGIEGGYPEASGIAETLILRCKFFRCSKAAVSIQNYNSLDWWIWYCLFEDCNYGVTNVYGAGNFHVYESVFRRSSTSDIKIGALCVFSVFNNFSSGSLRFLDAQNMIWAGCQITVQGNIVVDTVEPTPIYFGNRGPILLIDNIFKTDGQAPVVWNTGVNDGDYVSIGNTYTLNNPIQAPGRIFTLDDQVVDPASINVTEPDLPSIPLNFNRTVFEVPVEADSVTIQSIINEASQLNGQRPVVHFPAGRYELDRTLNVPANCDVQLVGDGFINGSQLYRIPYIDFTLLYLPGPCRATLRDLEIYSNHVSSSIVMDNCDQIGGRIHMTESLIREADQFGIIVDKLKYTNVYMYSACIGTNNIGMKIIGGGEKVEGNGDVIIFDGGIGQNVNSIEIVDDGKLLLRNIWFEGGWDGPFLTPRFFRLSNTGDLTLHGFSAAVSADEQIPIIEIDDFNGKVSLLSFNIGSQIETPTKIVIKGQGDKIKFLAMGGNFMDIEDRIINESNNAQVTILSNRYSVPPLISYQLPDEGNSNTEIIKEMLTQTRTTRPKLLTPVPDGVTDARFFRVFIQKSQIGIKITSGTEPFVNIKEKLIPQNFKLYQNFPNPFNAQTTISFDLPQKGSVDLSIYNVLGQRVRTLVNEELTAGHHSILWDGKDNYGKLVASGTYIYRINIGEFSKSMKAILLK